MRMRVSTLAFVGIVAVVCARPATATTLTFDSLPSSNTGGVLTASPVIESGFQLQAVVGSSFFAFQDGWQTNRGSSNGTTTLAIFANTCCVASFSVAAVGGAAFSLISIDVAELLNNGDFAFSGNAQTVNFTGHYSAGGTINLAFNLDMFSNGPAAPADFQTVAFSGLWSNLASVDVVASNSSNPFGVRLNFDNIQVAAVPEPASLLLLGSGFVSLAAKVRRRKNRLQIHHLGDDGR